MTIKGGKLRSVGEIVDILDKEGLHDLGFNIPRGKLKARQAIELKRVEELPSMSDIGKSDDIELQEITENAAKSKENLILQLEGESLEDLPICELLRLDKQLRNIQGSLKIETAKKIELQQCIK